MGTVLPGQDPPLLWTSINRSVLFHWHWRIAQGLLGRHHWHVGGRPIQVKMIHVVHCETYRKDAPVVVVGKVCSQQHGGQESLVLPAEKDINHPSSFTTRIVT